MGAKKDISCRRGIVRKAAWALAAFSVTAAWEAQGLSQTAGAPPAAGAAAVEEVDFPTAVARALEKDASVAAARHEEAAAESAAALARGALLPSLSLEEAFLRTNVPAEAFATKMNAKGLTSADFADVSGFNSPPPISDFVTSVSFAQPLFVPRAWVGWRMARVESGARGLDLARRREEAVHRVVAAYLDVLTAKRYLAVANRSVDDAREHLRAAEAAAAAGLGLASDVLRAKVFLARAEAEKVSAENRHALARKALALAIGEGGGREVDAASPLPPFPEVETAEERITRATSGRADLAALSARVFNASRAVDLERSTYLPSVALSGGYRLDAKDSPLSPDNRTWRIGVGLSWNLFDGTRREAAAAKAEAESRAARERLRGAQDFAAFQVAQALLAVEDAKARAAIARAALSAAEEGARLVKARHENQLARMIDLLDAQSALDTARADVVRAENDLLRARADLEYATGTLLAWAQGTRASSGPRGGK